jgi:hypothetical protein
MYIVCCSHVHYMYCSGPWEGSVRGPHGKGRHFEGRGTGAPSWGQWASVGLGQGRREVMTKWENTKKTTPSWLQDAIMHRVSVNVHQRKYSVNSRSNFVLIVLLFQENKSFGASTICIHPLMYVKPCREHVQRTTEDVCCTPFAVHSFIIVLFLSLSVSILVPVLLSAVSVSW